MENNELRDAMNRLRLCSETDKPQIVAIKQANALTAIAYLLQAHLEISEDNKAIEELRVIPDNDFDAIEVWLKKYKSPIPTKKMGSWVNESTINLHETRLRVCENCGKISASFFLKPGELLRCEHCRDDEEPERPFKKGFTVNIKKSYVPPPKEKSLPPF